MYRVAAKRTEEPLSEEVAQECGKQALKWGRGMGICHLLSLVSAWEGGPGNAEGAIRGAEKRSSI